MKEFPIIYSEKGPIDFNALMVIDDVNLERSFRIQAAWAPFFVWQHGLRKVNVARQKAKVKQVKAKCWLKHNRSPWCVTTAQVDAAVDNDPLVSKETEKLDALIEDEKRWYSALQAWEERSAMLVQIGAERRASMRLL